MSLLQPGQIIRDTYDVERFLGEGAFAEVYRVKHRFLGRQALKILKTPGSALEEIQSELAEALLLSRLGHPNIIRVFDANVLELAGEEYGYFTMEYIAGGTLDKYWQSFGNNFVPVNKAVDLVRQACRGIAAAHNENPPIIHRDIKPQNILVGYDEDGLRIRVSDFGLARHVNRLTLYASARGTLCFKSPEVFIDPSHDSCSGDVWALGCTLFLLLTDHLPYQRAGDCGPDPYAAFRDPWRDASYFNLNVDADLDAIIQKALAIEPKNRYADARQLLVDLESWHPQKAQPKVIDQKIESQKIALGDISPMDERSAESLAQKAITMAKSSQQLSKAADLLEEALVRSPHLREKYEYRLKLWRRGITS